MFYNSEANFQTKLKLTKNPVAAAILVLVDQLERGVSLNLDRVSDDAGDRIGQEFLLGIRHGLFGSGADSATSILQQEMP